MTGGADVRALAARRIHLVRVLASKGVDFVDAEDAVQDAFLSAWRFRHTFDPSKQTAWAWLICIAVRIARRHYRPRDTREMTREPSITVAMPDPGLRRAMVEAFDTLDDDARTVLELVHLRGVPYRKASRELGSTSGSLRVRACMARRQLRYELQRRGVAA